MTSIVFPRDPTWQPPGQITINPTPTPGRILAQVRNQFWGEVHTARQDRLGRVCRAFQLPEAFREHLARLELERAGVPHVGPDWYRPLPVGRITWSPAAYAARRGLTGPAADMFAEIAGIIQNARAETPW